MVLHHNKVEIVKFSGKIMEKGEKCQDLIPQMKCNFSYGHSNNI